MKSLFRSIETLFSFGPKGKQHCMELYEKYYGGCKFHDSLYRDLIWKHLRPGERLLDAGCGRYLRFCREFSPYADVVGIDLETVFETDNHQAPFAIRGDLGVLPFPGEHFDVIICRSVVEHLEFPEKVFREFQRVLKPGGRAVIITPNKYDYVSVVSAFTPYSFHQWLIPKIIAVPGHDVFPTFYRANTLSAIKRIMKTAGMNELDVDTINHYPAYLMFWPPAFLLGVLYERITSRPMFRSFRGSILGVFLKAAPAAVPVQPPRAGARQALGVS